MHKKTTTWSPRNVLHSSFLNTITKLERQYSNIEQALTERLFAVDKDTYHFVAELLREGSGTDRLERALESHILNIAYRTEVLSQGAGPVSLLFCIGFIKYLLTTGSLEKEQNIQKLVEDYQLGAAGVERVIRELVTTAKPQDIVNGVRLACTDDRILADVAWEALQLAGLEGKLFVENGKQPNYLVEHKEGYTFPAKPFKYFLNQSGHWEKPLCKILVVDGLIEKVSEIDHLLRQTYETKQPLIIVALGFSEEVVATLKANQERGNFEAIPVRVMPDVESLNMANDIAVVCGTTPISSLKGELLCFVKYEDLPSVEYVRCGVSDISIQNASTRPAVSAHISGLLDKRNENAAVEDLQVLIDRRLRALVPTTVTVHLKDMPPSGIDAARIKLDNSFRYAKSVLNHGVIEVAPLLETLPGDTVMEKAIKSGLNMACQGKKKIGALTAITAPVVAGRAMLTLLSSNGMVSFT